MPSSPETPKVSAIIPCYKGERFVVDAVESVLAQTEPLVEVIVVDDCSPDASVQTLEPLLSDPRVRLLQHDENRGISAARNTGIRASTAEFVGFLDHDDLWLPWKIERQLAVFDAGDSDLGFIFTPFETGDADGKPLAVFPGGHPPEGLNDMTRVDALRALYRGNFTSTPSVLMRRDCCGEVGMFDETLLDGGEDYEFWLRLLTRYTVKCLDEVTFVRRLHNTNFSSDRQRLVGGTLQFIERFGREHNELVDLVEPKLAWIHARLGSCHRNEGCYHQAISSFRTARSYGRLGPQATVAFLLCFLGPIGRWATRLRRELTVRRPGSQR